MSPESPNQLVQLFFDVDAEVVQKTKAQLDKSKNLAVEMQRMKFILALPVVLFESLPITERACSLCHQDYHPKFMVCGRETAVQLPDGCIFGHFCIRQWLSPYEDGHVSCPCGNELPQMLGKTTERNAGSKSLKSPSNSSIERLSKPVRDADFSNPPKTPILTSPQLEEALEEHKREMDWQVAQWESDTGMSFSECFTGYESFPEDDEEWTKIEKVSPKTQDSKKSSSSFDAVVESLGGVEPTSPRRQGMSIVRSAIKLCDLVAERGRP